MNTLVHLQRIFALALAAFVFHGPLEAQQIPQLLSYQGRVASNGVNFNGAGQFKFALVNAAGTVTYWSNDGAVPPVQAVPLTVTNGLYSVLLGDTTLANMTAIPSSVFSNADVRLRVWFSDGTNPSEQLTPDQRVAAVGYAVAAGSAATALSVPNGSIGSAQLAPGAVGATQLAAGAVTNAQLAANAVQTGNIAAGAVGNAQLANSALTVTAGTGLGGGGQVSLGGTVSLTNAGVLSLTGGGGITVSGASGAITLGSSATSANTAGTIVLRDASGNFGAGTVSVGNLSATGMLSLPATTGSSAGVLSLGGMPFLHAFGYQNIFVGTGAGNFTMTGINNTAVGANALQSNTTGSYNTVVGVSALGANGTTNSNTAVGYGALNTLVTGSQNIAIGSGSGTHLTSGNNNIYFYDGGSNGENNTIRIGSQNVQTATYIAGISGATSSGGAPVYVNSNGLLGTLTSSRRFKEGIVEMGDASDVLLALRPVCFRYKPEIDPNGLSQFGLIAEDVEKVDPDLVLRDAEGKVYTVRYEAVNAMLLNEFLKEHRKVQDQTSAMAEQQREIQALKADVGELRLLVVKLAGGDEVGERRSRTPGASPVQIDHSNLDKNK